jgi:mannose/fructose/N-acetylgalactosamine-specific phosphotransferase system component IIC
LVHDLEGILTMVDFSGPWWLVVDLIAVAILGTAMAYGVISWRKRRSASEERRREAATKELYTKPDSQLPPSDR